ncbi:MAG: hypothetical protein N2316_06770 [Spirochaetes bacterium]|nr:hypothetical protein [Spirochaetota bacterium]
MKCIMQIVFVICVLLFPISIRAKENNNISKETLIVFKFKDLSKTDEFAYYSYIIPDSLAIEIKNRTNLDVRSHAVTIPYLKIDEAGEKNKDHILYLSRKGNELAAHYTISGSYEIKNNKIYIFSQLFHVESKRLIDVGSASDELGVLIFELIDSLTNKINDELEKLSKQNIAKKEEIHHPHASTSPFLPIYRTIENLILYGEHGSMNIKESWGDIYKNANYYILGIQYELANFNYFKTIPILQNASLTASYHRFIVHAKNMSSSLIVSGFAGGLLYRYPIVDRFFVSAEISIGSMFSTLHTYPPNNQNGGPPLPLFEIQSQDPLLRCSLMIGYRITPLVFWTGVSLNRISYIDEPLEFSTLLFGLGFQL